jgi:orotidine-5'-phosphate decarboxylase
MLLVAVTVLTSLGSKDLNDLGISVDVHEQVNRLTSLAKKAGMDGVVASAMEASELRDTHGEKFIIVTPGIRLDSTKFDDQNRVVTPTQAIINGSDYLVIGRPITQALNPSDKLKYLNTEILKIF